MSFIAIDCGASYIKGALIKEDEIVKITEKRTINAIKKDNITSIVYVNELINNVEAIITELADEKEIELGLSNEMHGFILCDSDGNAITDYISWQCEFGNIVVDAKSSVELLKEQCQNEIKKTGMPLRAGLPSSNLRYVLKQIDRQQYRKVMFYTLGDYILRYLSGIEPACHPTNAAATGLYDLEKDVWNYSIIQTVGDKDIVFPKIGEKGIEFDYEGHRIKAYPAIGDQQAALLGAGFNEINDLSFNIGTGAQVTRIIDDIVYCDKIQVRPYFEGKYLHTIPHIPSGRALNVFVSFIESVLAGYGIIKNECEIWEGIQKSLDGPENATMCCDISFFENAVTENKSATISQIRENEFSFDNMIKSVFNQMVDNFISMSERVNMNKSNPDRIIFTGGVARKNNYIRNHIAEAYENCEVLVKENETMEGIYRYYKLLEGTNK